MKLSLSNNWKVYAWAVLYWLVVFIISAFFVDPATGLPKFNLYLFHFVLFVIATVVLFGFFGLFKKWGWVSDATFISFLLVNIGLDFAFLIPFFGVSVGEWFTLILPSYLIGTAIVYAVFGKKNA
jgi:hypothetical protein